MSKICPKPKNRVQHNTGRLDKTELLITVGILVLALFVRLCYLYQSSANPSFTTPTVDSRVYDNLARSVADGRGMNAGFFWQPFFYPALLSVIYLAGNSSIICAKVIQLLLGCVTCLLTYRLGKRIFDRRTAVIAAVMTALYGPLVFFESELLAAGWAAFWSVLLILLFIQTSLKKSLWLCAVLGICGALSIITRPTFLLFFTAAVLWLAISFHRTGDGWRRIAPRFAAILTGFLLIAIPVAVQNLRVTGHFGFLPASGGINVYIGNNPNYAETIIARPGAGWEEIVEMPNQSGVIEDRWEHQKFYEKQVLNYVFTEPLGFLSGLAYKTIQFLNSREIPRNVGVYAFGKWSRLLRLLTWKVGGFGFPFGLLLPLVLLGLAGYRRQIPAPLLLFLILYPLSIILVFVAARYRVPVIPAMSILAAAGLLKFIRIVHRLYWRRIAVVSLFAVAIVLLSSLPGPFTEEKFNFEAVLYYNVASAENLKGKDSDALAHFNKALELMPDYAPAHFGMGTVLEKTGRIDQAVRYYQQALQLKPDYAKAHNNMGIVLQSQGKLNEAVSHYRQALQIKPHFAKAHNNLGIALQSQSRLDEAIAHFMEVVRLDPHAPKAHYVLARALNDSGRAGEAVTHFKEVLRLRPDWLSPMNSLAWILATHKEDNFRNPQEAIRLAERACELTNYEDAGLVDTLAAAYAAAGRFSDAVATAEKAVKLAARTDNKERAEKIQNRLELYKQKKTYRQPSYIEKSSE